MLPSHEESLRAIRQRASDIAAEVLAGRGLSFREIAPGAEADHVFANDVRRFIAEEDIEAAAACLMQLGSFVTAEVARPFCEVLCRMADAFFYDRGDSETSLRLFQLAAGVNADYEEAVRGTVTVCLQGSPQRPAMALPYAVLQAAIHPSRDETSYILDLIAQSDAHYSQ